MPLEIFELFLNCSCRWTSFDEKCPKFYLQEKIVPAENWILIVLKLLSGRYCLQFPICNFLKSTTTYKDDLSEAAIANYN